MSSPEYIHYSTNLKEKEIIIKNKKLKKKIVKKEKKKKSIHEFEIIDKEEYNNYL